MPFDVYFPIREVAARLGKSPKTVKRLAEKGELGTVWRIAGDLTIGEAGLLAFLDRHVEDFSSQARELRRQAYERRFRRPPARGPVVAGVSARSEGELRRKVEAVATADQGQEDVA